MTDCLTASTNTSPTAGNLTRTVSWLNGGTNPEVRSAYDAYGNAICSRDPLGNVTQTSYDSTRTFPVSLANALGHTTTAYYGVDGVPWSTAATDPGLFGLVKSTTDPNLATTTLQYDVFGRKTASIFRAAEPAWRQIRYYRLQWTTSISLANCSKPQRG